MKIIKIPIKNSKVDLLYGHDSSLPIVNFKLVFKNAGAISGANGLSAICAKIFNEGTKSLGVSEFSRLLEIKAIEIYASCGFETFVIEVNSLKEHFAFALKMLKDLLDDPNLTQDIFDKLKFQTYGEIASLKSEFDYIANLELNRILHPNSPLANPTVGTKKSIEKLTLGDVSNFIKEHLSLENLFMVLGGDVDLEGIKFSEILHSIESGNTLESIFIKTSPDMHQSVIKQKSEQAYIYFGAPFHLKKDEIYKANVLAFVLGSSGFGSRLMEEIRVKRGLAYSVYAKNELTLTYSRIWGYLQTKNENMKDAICLVKSEFDNMVKKGITRKELDGAKNFLLGSVVLQKETMFKRLAIAQHEYYQGYKFGELDRNLKRISKLTLKDINEFIISHNEILNLSFASLCDEI